MSSGNRVRSSAVTLPAIDAAQAETSYQTALTTHLAAQATGKTGRRAGKGDHRTSRKQLRKQQQRAGTAAPSAAVAVAKPERKKESEFSLLLKRLDNISAIAQYISAEHNKELRTSKGLNNLLQALSQRPAALFETLFSQHKAETVAILESVHELSGAASAASMAASSDTTLTPAAHEFVLRCLNGGVARKAWAEDVKPLDGAAPSTQTTRQIIKTLLALDPKGNLQRRVELASSATDLTDAIEAVAAAEEDTFTPGERLGLLMKVVSKARRLLGRDDDAAEKDEADEEGAPKKTKHVITTTPFSTDESGRVVKTLLDFCYDIFVRRGVAPTSKVGKFIDWCTEKSLIPEDYVDIVAKIGTASGRALENQAANLELLLELKQADVAKEPFVALLDKITDVEKGVFTATGVDVLSAVAVAAGRFGEDEALTERVVNTLVATVKANAGYLHLPRRALTFIAAFRQRRQQAEKAEMKKKREREDEERQAGGLGFHPILDDDVSISEDEATEGPKTSKHRSEHA